MNRIILIAFLPLFLLGCSQKQKFDSIKWKQYKSIEPGDKSRYNMVDDFVNSKIWQNKTKKEIIDLLGDDTEWYTEWSIVYPVYQYYGTDIDPIYVTTLELSFKDDYCHFARHRVVLDKR